jgi:hypothetical protein
MAEEPKTTKAKNAGPDAMTLRVNGAVLAVAKRPALAELDGALRGIALSDSPVLISARREDDRAVIASRIHTLGRRRELPLRVCLREDEAKPLLVGALDERTGTDVRGTWALHGVGTWSSEMQHGLAAFLRALDEWRLHGRIAHERIPRVVVIEGPDGRAKLDPELVKRLSFFDVAAS